MLTAESTSRKQTMSKPSTVPSSAQTSLVLSWCIKMPSYASQPIIRQLPVLIRYVVVQNVINIVMVEELSVNVLYAIKSVEINVVVYNSVLWVPMWDSCVLCIDDQSCPIRINRVSTKIEVLLALLCPRRVQIEKGCLYINHQVCSMVVVTRAHDILPLVQIVVIYFLFRSKSEVELPDLLEYNTELIAVSVLEEITDYRKEKALPEHTGLFDYVRGSVWGTETKGSKIHAAAIAVGIAGKEPPRHAPDHDHKWMRQFCLNIKSSSCVYVFPGVKFDELLPCRGSVADYIALLQTRPDCWGVGVLSRKLINRILLNRGINFEWANKVTVKEIVISRTATEEIEEVWDFIWASYKADQEECPNALMSADVEELRIYLSEWESLCHGPVADETSVVLNRNFKKGKDKVNKSKNLPVKFMIGNGMSWAVMISVPVDVHEGKWSVPFLTFQPELLTMMSRLPTMTGVGVERDISQYEDFVHAVSGQNSFKLPGCVELGVKAHAAGWTLPTTNMPILSYQLTGGAMHKRVSQGDKTWGKPWAEISDPLKCYCLGDLKMGYQSAVVLYGAMLINFFPDPDIVLSTLRCSHRDFGVWWGKFLAEFALRGVEIKTEKTVGLKTYLDCIMALCFREENGTQSINPPYRTTLLAAMHGGWPSITKGNARYLPQVRAKFLLVCGVLNKANPPGWKELMPVNFDPMQGEVIEAATYGISNYNSFKESFKEPTSEPLGLGLPESWKKQSVYNLKGADMNSAVVRNVITEPRRIMRETVLEWVRMNVESPTEIEDFLSIIATDLYYKQWLRTYYTEARLIFRRATGVPAPWLDQMDETLYRKDTGAIQGESNKISQIDDEVDEIDLEIRDLNLQIERLEIKKEKLLLDRNDREHRIEVLEERRELQDTTFPAASWRGQLPKLTSKEYESMKRSRLDYEPEVSADLAERSKPEHWQDLREVLDANEDYFDVVEHRDCNEWKGEVGRHPKSKKRKGPPGGPQIPSRGAWSNQHETESEAESEMMDVVVNTPGGKSQRFSLA